MLTRSDVARLKVARAELMRVDQQIAELREWVDGAETHLDALGPRTLDLYLSKRGELDMLLSTIPTAEDLEAAKTLTDIRLVRA